MSKKVGLVLAGGGGKGAYHIGVWKALREFKVDANINYVSGTSVGALNAALFAQGNLEAAEEVWWNISSDDILHINSDKISEMLPSNIDKKLISNFFKSHGIFSRKGLERIMEKYINFNTLHNSEIYATCSDVTLYPPGYREVLALSNAILGKKFGKESYFRLKNFSESIMKKILFASSALPVVFDTEEIDGSIYYDGGLTDNVPIKPLYDEGCKVIFVVHLNRSHVINHDNFPDAQIFEIIPQDSQGGLFTGTLDFTQEGAKKRIDQGYEDAVRMLKPVYEMGLTQLKIKKALHDMHEDELKFKSRRYGILEEREELKNEIEELIGDRKIGG